MDDVVWFSSGARFAVQIEGRGVVDEMRSVIVFLARDFDDGRERALNLFLAKETSYINGDGEKVDWRLIQLDTLDELGERIADGREVYAEQLPPSDEAAEAARIGGYSPGEHTPLQSGV
jgi:hypothetical protein